MDPVTISRRIARHEYEAVRWPFALLDDHVISRFWEEDASLRSGFERFLGSLDRFAGWVLSDETIFQRGQDLRRRNGDTVPAAWEQAAENLAPKQQAVEEPAMAEAAMVENAQEPLAEEPPTEELTLPQLAAEPAAQDQAGQLTTPAEPVLASTVDVTFTLPGEVGAGQVVLCADFTDWTAGNIALQRGGDGAWQVTVPLEPGHSYRYRYLLDGERWENAWQADRYESNPFGTTNSVVTVRPPELALAGMS